MRDARWVGVRVVYGILKGKRLCFDRLRELRGKSLSSSRKRPPLEGQARTFQGQLHSRRSLGGGGGWVDTMAE